MNYTHPFLLLFISLIVCVCDEYYSIDPAHVLIINATTKLQDIFQCSHLHSIGIYNEYYISCRLRNTNFELIDVQNVYLDSSKLAPIKGIHIELELKTVQPSHTYHKHASPSSIRLVNSTIVASAVRMQSHTIIIDHNSVVNSTAQGLKFGPGYNSYLNMGGSYGGIGGAALSGIFFSGRSCDHVPPLDFYKPLGDIGGGLANFRGYGSGGGGDQSRGGGLVEMHAEVALVVNGSLLANGANAPGDSTDSAGAGGTVILKSEGKISGTGTIQSNGGEPSVYTKSEGTGGGGGGGGGRIVMRYETLVGMNSSQIQAFGGGVEVKEKNKLIQWCQLGGDGTILKTLIMKDAKVEVGTILLNGRQLNHTSPSQRIQMYGCTPLFEHTSRDEPFIPLSVAQLCVHGGATLCTSGFTLPHNVSSVNSTITLDPGSQLHGIEYNDGASISISASAITIQSYVGPFTQRPRDRFRLHIECETLTFANALVVVDELDVNATSNVTIDKYSVTKFAHRVSILSEEGTIQVNGILEPTVDDEVEVSSVHVHLPSIFVTSETKDVLFTPGFTQIDALHITIHAPHGHVHVDIPFEAAALKFVAYAEMLTVVRASSGSASTKCEAIKSHGDPKACSSFPSKHKWSTDSEYLLSFIGMSALTVGNLTSGSILLCSDGVVNVNGFIIADNMGCAAGEGPGASRIVASASGGAGHGGRGGNVEPGNTGGGKQYDYPSHFDTFEMTSDIQWPIWPGSGAATGGSDDQIIGGSGGGMIYVGAAKLVIGQNGNASITARGNEGMKSGGGGSGGSIVLSIAELDGAGVIDASGGGSSGSTKMMSSLSRTMVWKPRFPSSQINEGKERSVDGVGGGGGGGGIIRTFFRGLSGNGDKFLANGGLLINDGGKSHTGGEDGGPGLSAAMNCSGGRGGALCTLCDSGSYSPNDTSTCMPCEPGSFSDRSGMTACSPCPIGSSNPDFGKTVCELCPTGMFAKTVGTKQCSPCPAGSFADHVGSSNCTLCGIGTIARISGTTECTLCGIGQTTLKTGALYCTDCSTKPEHSSFNVHGNCTYACDKGRNGLDCLTPFERLIKPIGGPLGFVILVFTFASIIFGLCGFLTYRNARNAQQRFAEYKAQTLRDQLSLANLTQNLTPRLTDQDLQLTSSNGHGGHIARIYFKGDNHFESSWELPLYELPPELTDVQTDSYITFANTCNELVSWGEDEVLSHFTQWERLIHRLCLITIPPLSTIFLRRRQLLRVERLVKYITQYSGGFLSFRLHGAQMKVGFSPDFSLAYIDIVASTSTGSNKGGAPTLLQTPSNTNAITIVIAGSGSFFRPYYADPNDVLVRSILARLQVLQHIFWIDFIAELNERLRLVSQPTTKSRVKRAVPAVYDIINFIAVFNKKHSREGIHVVFGTYTTRFHAFSDNVEDNKGFENLIEQRLESYRIMEQFKFAFQIWKNSSTSPALRTRTDDATKDTLFAHSQQHSEKMISVESDPRPVEFRYSQIRMEALFARTPSTAALDDLVPDNSDNYETPLFGGTKSIRRRSRHIIVRLMDLLLCSSRSRGIRWLLMMVQPIAPLFRLQNVQPRKMASHLVLPALMVLLIVLDAMVAFWVLMEYYCVQVEDPTPHNSGCSRVAISSVLSILPLAIIGSPSLAIVFLSRKSVFYGKLFAAWNSGSLINLVVALVCGVVYKDNVHESVVLVILGGLVLKLIEKYVALLCIAQYIIERPIRGWRGLYTTKDWYDAAYTPLIHDER